MVFDFMRTPIVWARSAKITGTFSLRSRRLEGFSVVGPGTVHPTGRIERGNRPGLSHSGHAVYAAA